MKCVFWNIRGLAHSLTRLALNKIIKNNNPYVVLIAEPWMDDSFLPARWLQMLGLKLKNDRSTRLPNIWCICKVHLNLVVMYYDDQCILFSIMDNSIV